MSSPFLLRIQTHAPGGIPTLTAASTPQLSSSSSSSPLIHIQTLEDRLTDTPGSESESESEPDSSPRSGIVFKELTGGGGRERYPLPIEWEIPLYQVEATPSSSWTRWVVSYFIPLDVLQSLTPEGLTVEVSSTFRTGIPSSPYASPPRTFRFSFRAVTSLTTPSALLITFYSGSDPIALPAVETWTPSHRFFLPIQVPPPPPPGYLLSHAPSRGPEEVLSQLVSRFRGGGQPPIQNRPPIQTQSPTGGPDLLELKKSFLSAFPHPSVLERAQNRNLTRTRTLPNPEQVQVQASPLLLPVPAPPPPQDTDSDSSEKEQEETGSDPI